MKKLGGNLTFNSPNDIPSVLNLFTINLRNIYMHVDKSKACVNNKKCFVT